jgi:hypothetical protein
MSQTRLMDEAEPAGARLTPLIFGLAIFTSAMLVFSVQPMITKLVLPVLGGSPSVWNTAMVFFQTGLLAGYAYAHLLQKVASLRSQVGVHLLLLLVAATFLPLRVNGLLGDPDPAAPVAWLLLTLTLSVGLPFAVLSATAPLLQAWFARVRVGHVDGQNPYVLYAASNFGSFLALLAYPVLIEPLSALSAQRWGWSVGYGVFVVMILALGLTVWQARAATRSEPAPLARTPAIDWRERGIWVLLAAAPSSLMLGVTAHLTTDVASAPFLWVIPLALYLLTFVIAFQNRPWIPLPITLIVQSALLAVTVSMAAFRSSSWNLMLGINLSTFFFTALLCHQLLASRRPPPDRLTEFYLLLSVGGMVGGVFNALIAPVVFNMVWEYPLVLVAVGLARPWGGTFTLRHAYFLLSALFLVVLPHILIEVIRQTEALWPYFQNFSTLQLASIILGAAAICAFLVRDKALVFTGILMMIALSAQHLTRGYDWSLTERSFFGVMRVAQIEEPRMGGPVHVLMHGTTLHGAQALDPDFACDPTMYYAPTTPIGVATWVVQSRAEGIRMGVVGLGSGAMAAYKRPGDSLTFFEIDPMVDRMARDPRWFTYISDCASGPVQTVLGDARLSLAKQPEAAFDLLIIDAFSSDVVPTHLLTVEALADYLRLVGPTGVVVLHLSNRNLDITLPAVAAARQLGATERHRIYIEDKDRPAMAEASTEVLILSATEQGLADFVTDPGWKVIAPTTVRPWTDDYVNLWGALVRANF